MGLFSKKYKKKILHDFTCAKLDVILKSGKKLEFKLGDNCFAIISKSSFLNDDIFYIIWDDDKIFEINTNSVDYIVQHRER